MKIGNLYNLDAMSQFQDSLYHTLGGKKFKDAAMQGVVLSHTLVEVDPRIFERKYPGLALLESGIQANNIGGYSAVIESLRLEDRGGFTTSKSNANDKGTITLSGDVDTINVLERTAQSNWTESELKQAAMQGFNLPSRLLQTHNKIYQREIDEIGLLGSGPNEGLLYNSLFTTTAASGPASGMTGVVLYNTLAGEITSQWDGVLNTAEFKAGNMIMPVNVYNLASTKLLDETSPITSKTVLSALRDNFPDVNFLPSFRADGTGTSSRTVVFSNDSESMVMRIPQPLTISAVDQRGWNYHVESLYRIAGLDILEPLAGRILTGL